MHNYLRLSARLLLAIAIPALLSCANSVEPEEAIVGQCITDLECPLGQECSGSGCGATASTIYPNIQLSSTFLRPDISAAEIEWRAAHADLHIPTLGVDETRSVNPDIREFEYVLIRYNRFEEKKNAAAVWAAANGYDPEDFYLHYREDVEFPAFASRVLVPGFPPGLVPGWNPDPQPGDPPASATERSQARAMGGGGPYPMANLEHPGYRRFILQHIIELLDGTFYFGRQYPSGPINGIMIDLGLYYPQWNDGVIDKTIEYAGIPMSYDHPYALTHESLYQGLIVGLHRHFGSSVPLMPNYGHVLFLGDHDPIGQAVQRTTPWAYGEAWVMYHGTSSPTTGSARCINYESDYETGVADIVRQTLAGGRRVLGARDVPLPGTSSDRGRLLTLGLYYLMHNANTFYGYENVLAHGAGHADPVWTWQWNAAVEFDVGRPDVVPSGTSDFDGRTNTREHYELATGPDPYRSDLTYHLLARNFTNALVLVKLLPSGSVVDDRSITTHPLDRSYAILQADGTLGQIVTVASIRNNESLILIPVD